MVVEEDMVMEEDMLMELVFLGMATDGQRSAKIQLTQ